MWSVASPIGRREGDRQLDVIVYYSANHLAIILQRDIVAKHINYISCLVCLSAVTGSRLQYYAQTLVKGFEQMFEKQ